MGGIFTVKKFHFQNDFGSILERGRNSSSKNRLFLKTSPSLVTRFTHRVLGRGWGNLFLPKIPTQKTTTKTGSVLRGTCNISSSFFDQNFDLNLGLDRGRNSEQKKKRAKNHAPLSSQPAPVPVFWGVFYDPSHIDTVVFDRCFWTQGRITLAKKSQ